MLVKGGNEKYTPLACGGWGVELQRTPELDGDRAGEKRGSRSPWGGWQRFRDSG